MSNIKFSRMWSMPSSNTFQMKPIAEFVERYVEKCTALVDPFARNHIYYKPHYTNDINPNTVAQTHKDAVIFLKELKQFNYKIDLIVLDMPYTARQISECYKEIGIKVTQKHTQIGSFYKDVKDASDALITPNGVVLTFGYSSVGMGIKRGYKIEEIRLVAQGGPHFDVICVAERKL